MRVEVVELRDLAHELVDNLLTGFPSGALADAVAPVRDADAVIAVSPIFDASYSGLFKMFFDVLEEGTLEGKPVLLAATAGTARHSLALEFAMRPLFAYLRADVVPTAVFAASEDFGSSAAARCRPGWTARRASSRTPYRPRRPVRPGRPVRRPDAVRAAPGGRLLGTAATAATPEQGHLQRCTSTNLRKRTTP